MGITATKVFKEMIKNYGWSSMMQEHNEILVKEAIKDAITIIDKTLIKHKNISIK